MKKIIAILAFALATATAVAQQDMTFRHISSKDGLSNNSVRSILRERNGLLWLGTAYGLNRYDGYHFRRYALKAENGTLCQDIWNMQQDHNNSILVCANGIYFLYDRQLNTFSQIDKRLKADGVNTTGDHRILLTDEGNYWVFAGREAFYYNTKTRKTVSVATDGRLPESSAAFGNIAYSTLRDNNIYVSSPQSRRWTAMPMPAGVFPENSTKRIYIDSRGGIYVSCYSSNNILYKQTAAAKWQVAALPKIESLSEAEGINALCQDNRGGILVASDHTGLFRMNPTNGVLTLIAATQSDESSLLSNNIAAIYVDSQNTIWAGHNKVGISYSNDSFGFVRFHHFNSLADVCSLYCDASRQLYIGTDGQGLFRWNRGSTPVKLPLPNKAYIAIASDSKSRIWAAAYNSGIYICADGYVEQTLTTTNSRLCSASNWGLLADKEGFFWVYSSEGVQRINMSTLAITDVPDSEGEKIIAFNMAADNNGNMFVGTINGILKISTATLHQQSIRGNRAGTQQFLEEAVPQVYVSGDGTLWAGSNRGLSVYDMATDSIIYLTETNGLGCNAIRAIGETAGHSIVVTTANGLSIIDTSREPQGSLRLTCRNVSSNSGVGDSYFNNFALCTVGASTYCGNANGITEIDDSKTNTALAGQDSLFLAAASIGSEPIECGRKIRISHDSEQLRLEFSTPDIIGAHNIRFAYMIKERDKEWQNMQDNTLSLVGLAPGSYTLSVKATNRYGQWTDKALTLTITVKPPLYMTWWAYLIYIVAAAVVIGWYIRRYKRQQAQRLEGKRRALVYETQQKADKLKIDFFISLSHDLRTPLTLILTPLQMLRKQRLPDAISRKLDVMEENANRLNEMITSIMDYRKVEAGDTLNVSTCDLPTLIREVSRNFERQATYSGKSFSVDCEPGSLAFSFDRQKMKRILENLLSNAVKYTKSGDSIGLAMRRRDSNAVINVYDTGMGIKDEDKRLVFNLFYRAKAAEQWSGTGIGLYLVTNYVQMHGGGVAVKDHLPRGTEFEVTIPIRGLSDDTLPEEASSSVEQAIEQERDLIDETAAAKTNLLIVDDNKQICELLSEELSDTYNVVSAYDGEQALRLLYSNNIDIVVTDIAMPVMDGIQLCKSIKEDINISHTPVIMLTAKITDGEKIKGLTAGADEYLCKPVNIDMLRLRIEKIMEWKENSRQLFSKSVSVEPSAITITHLDEEFIKKAISLVERHMDDSGFSVEQLGSEMGMSRSHLYKKMMAIIGKSPNDFIHTLRMKRARQLLEQSGMNVSEVAYAVGFSSPRRFTVCFKKEFNDIPSAFMGKNTAKNDV